MASEKNNEIRLLILVKSIDGGTGTFLINLLNLGKVFPGGKIITRTLVLERPSFRDVRGYRFEYFRKNNFYPEKYSFSPFNFLYFFQELAWIGKKNSEFKFTHIISIDMRCNLLAIILKMLSFRKIRVVATNHIDLRSTISDKSTKPTTVLLWHAIRFFYRYADALVCSSRKLSVNMRRNFRLKKKILWIYDGLDIKVQKAKRFSQRREKKIISVARLVEQKDYPNLLDAFKLVEKRLPETRLWIASDGPLKKMLKEYAKNLKLNHTRFLGWVDNLNQKLKEADIFVLSSKREGFGYVLVEAMAQGLPVISTDTPDGPAEVLGDGKYGILVPMKDPVALKSAILDLLTTKKKYENFANKSIVRSKFFSLEKMLQGYKKIILNVS